MMRKVLAIMLMGSLMSCHKTQTSSGCGTQVCTAIYAIIGINFTDKDGKPLIASNFSAVNQRTKLTTGPSGFYTVVPGYYIIADDGSRSQFSTEGDNVLITATNPATGQTKTVTYKISGGCNCHVEKLSGVATLAFD